MSAETENDSPTAWPGVGYWPCPHDQDTDLRERVLEGPQDVLARRQVRAAGGDLGPQEVAHRGDLAGRGRQSLSPAGLDDLL